MVKVVREICRIKMIIMKYDPAQAEILKKRVETTFKRLGMGFAALGSAALRLSISIEECSEILAENAERFKEYESNSD